MDNIERQKVFNRFVQEEAKVIRILSNHRHDIRIVERCRKLQAAITVRAWEVL